MLVVLEMENANKEILITHVSLFFGYWLYVTLSIDSSSMHNIDLPQYIIVLHDYRSLGLEHQ